MSAGEKIVVTGAAGMVGSHVVAALCRVGCRQLVAVLHAPESHAKWLRQMARLKVSAADQRCITVLYADLSVPSEVREVLRGASTVYHCAARVSLSGGVSADELVGYNTRITSNVVDALLDCAPQARMVHVSSIATLGGGDPGEVLNEDSYAKTVFGWSAYGISKLYAENEVWRGIRMGLHATIINPGVILGVDDWSRAGSTAHLVAQIARGLNFYTEGISSYVDVRDVAAAMIALTEHPETIGKRYLAAAHSIMHRDLMWALADRFGVARARHKASLPFLRTLNFGDAVWSFVSRTPRRLGGSAIRSMSSKTLYYSDRLFRATGLEFRPLNETLDFIAEQYREESTLSSSVETPRKTCALEKK